MKTPSPALILHNIRSAYNVGSAFRTADAAGVSHIYLSGYTPAPLDRFGNARSDIAKTALGAEQYVSWSTHRSAAELVMRLRRDGYHIVGVEQDARAIDHRDLCFTSRGGCTHRLEHPVAFCFGNEVRGLSNALRARCDALAEIPMHGHKASLNVSVAIGVFLFRVLS